MQIREEMNRETREISQITIIQITIIQIAIIQIIIIQIIIILEVAEHGKIGNNTF